MKKFSAEMKVVRFGAEDMIVTSGIPNVSFTLSGFDNGNVGDGQAVLDGTTYQLASQADSFYSALEAYGGGISRNSIIRKASTGDSHLSDVVAKEAKTDDFKSTWDGTFAWTGNHFHKQQ